MKTLILLAVFVSVTAHCLCQPTEQIDSLRKLLKSDKNLDTDRVNILSGLAWMFYTNAQYDSALVYYSKALYSEQSKGESVWLGNMYLGIGVTYLHLDRWDSSFFYHKKAEQIFEDLGDSVNLATVYTNHSIFHKNKGLYEEALSYALKALSLLENKSASVALGSCYNNIGTICLRMKDYDNATACYRQALRHMPERRSREVARVYNNLGELFLLIGHYDSAKVNLLRSAEIKKEHHDIKGYAHCLAGLGKVSMLTGDVSLAETQLLESLKTQRQIHDSVGMIETLNNLGEVYLITNRLSESDKILLEANTITHSIGTPDYLRQNLELRVMLARKQKDFKTGMILQDELLIIRDSLLNEEKSKSLQAMQIRYETQKKEQAIALLEQREEINRAKIQSNRIVISALITGLILLAAIGLLIYQNLKNARAAKQRIELLLAETRHRMKNHLQTLASIFHLQTRHYTNHEMVLEAKSSESRVHTMSLLHDKFFTQQIDDVLNARDYISDLVHKLVDVHGSQTRNLKLSLEVENVDLDIDKAFALSLIIQELVCNAFKYAFDHEPNPELLLNIHQKDDHVHTMIHDNGIGFTGNAFGTSQGLNLVDALVSQLDGEMHVDNNRGTTFMIRFPATSPWKKPAFS